MEQENKNFSRIPLSVAIITKNEEKNLPGCLESVNFADQIVVVDSGSTEETVSIAKSFGCDVFIESWRGFGLQKQYAIEKCRYDWVLVLDADERIPESTAGIIQQIVCGARADFAGYSFPRKNFFQGRWIRHMGWWPDRVVRLFRRKLGKMSPDLVHESIMIEGKVGELTEPIEHFTESRLTLVLEKINRYSTLGAEEAYRNGKRASVFSAVFRAGFTFFQDYFLRLGFLDGAPGLTLSLTDSVNKFFKYAKLSELSRKGHLR